MARLRAIQSVSDYSLPGSSTTRTVIQIKAPTNQRVALKGLSITFKGQVNANSPPLCELVLQSSAGTSSGGTPVALDGDYQETIQTATLISFSATEPTLVSIVMPLDIHPQSGLVILPGPEDLYVLKGGARLGLRITGADVVAVSASMIFEE